MFNLASSLVFLKFLYTQRITGFKPGPEPHLDPEALLEFKRLLGKCHAYLEFGSGGSTLLAAHLGKPTLSVECDPFFAAGVRAAIGTMAPVEIIDVSIGITRDWGFPVITRATPDRLRRWKRYSEAPFQKIVDRGTFPDFVLVDGRFRRACALQTASHAAAVRAPVTIMIDDYLDGRDHYHTVEKFLGAPSKIGRAGIFEIGPRGPKLVPGRADIDEASSDFR
jgi:hypothetical protein